jgi:hypothetical protein
LLVLSFDVALAAQLDNKALDPHAEPGGRSAECSTATCDTGAGTTSPSETYPSSLSEQGTRGGWDTKIIKSKNLEELSGKSVVLFVNGALHPPARIHAEILCAAKAALEEEAVSATAGFLFLAPASHVTSRGYEQGSKEIYPTLRREHIHKGLELLTRGGCLSDAAFKLHWDPMGDDEDLGGRGSNVAQAHRELWTALATPLLDDDPGWVDMEVLATTDIAEIADIREGADDFRWLCTEGYKVYILRECSGADRTCENRCKGLSEEQCADMFEQKLEACGNPGPYAIVSIQTQDPTLENLKTEIVSAANFHKNFVKYTDDSSLRWLQTTLPAGYAAYLIGVYKAAKQQWKTATKCPASSCGSDIQYSTECKRGPVPACGDMQKRTMGLLYNYDAMEEFEQTGGTLGFSYGQVYKIEDEDPCDWEPKDHRPPTKCDLKGDAGLTKCEPCGHPKWHASGGYSVQVISRDSNEYKYITALMPEAEKPEGQQDPEIVKRDHLYGVKELEGKKRETRAAYGLSVSLEKVCLALPTGGGRPAMDHAGECTVEECSEGGTCTQEVVYFMKYVEGESFVYWTTEKGSKKDGTVKKMWKSEKVSGVPFCVDKSTTCGTAKDGKQIKCGDLGADGLYVAHQATSIWTTSLGEATRNAFSIPKSISVTIPALCDALGGKLQRSESSCVDEDVPNAVASTGVFDCERGQLIHVNSADGSLKFTSAGADQEKLLEVCKGRTIQDVYVTVPDNATAGEALSFSIDGGGTQYEVKVPEGVEPGDQFHAQAPKACKSGLVRPGGVPTCWTKAQGTVQNPIIGGIVDHVDADTQNVYREYVYAYDADGDHRISPDEVLATSRKVSGHCGAKSTEYFLGGYN